MKIGLFGGTFNPIHRCHLSIAAYAQEQLVLDRILFIPTGDPPHKPSDSLAPSHHRLEMVRLALATHPTFDVSDVEIRHPSKSYSIDTVQTLQRELGTGTDLFFIIGLDAFLEFHTWKRAPELLRTCRFVVLGRPGSSFRSLYTMPLWPPTAGAPLAALDAQQQRRIDVPVPGGTTLTLLWMPPCNVSASAIRHRIARRRAVSNLLPASVESYIMQTNLYREESDHTGV